jgi:hypothetical protein
MHAERKLWIEAAALLAAIVLASMLAWPAHGQAPNSAQPGSAPCSPSLQPGAPGGRLPSAQEQPNPASPPDNLSNRLASSGGVICPPSNVDPEIKLPTPETGNTMPVIPPPGSPGGDPSVQPK